MEIHTLSHREPAAGFTLIELVTVLLISTVILAVTIPRFATSEQFEARGYVEQTLSAIRYAQKFAIASGCDVEVNLGNAGYSLKKRGGLGVDCQSTSAFSGDVSDPSAPGRAFSATPPSGITVSGGPVSFYYDRVGRPVNPLSDMPLVSATNITISGAGYSWTLTIEPETGYVHL